MNKVPVIVITGGSGYIAGYTLNYIVEHNLADKVYLLDLKSPRSEIWTAKTKEAFENDIVIYQHTDVREPISLAEDTVDLIFNFAAIHREPGHEPREYFETNIKGAENVVSFAERCACETIVFTSSIAPYGHADEARTENSQVVPYSPYGSSKLVAEKIHEAWRSRAPDVRSLVTARPGVIFGPHEDGNVPRLKNALLRRIFCYVGNKSVHKSGGYVKELANSMLWMLDDMKRSGQRQVLYNFSFPSPPVLSEYVDAICEVAGIRRFVPDLPFGIILFTSRVISAFFGILGIDQPIHPERIKKLRVDNMIIPQVLIDKGYPFKFDLKSAFLDWKADTPEEWR